jgi:uncharacterized protein YcgI (DUF1989 family)
MTARRVATETLVPAGHGAAFEAAAGQYITIVDVAGQQIGDFVAFNRDDPAEWLSPSHTRVALLSMRFRPGDRLVTSRRRPILEVIADPTGVHDFSVPACDPTRYETYFGIHGHRNCQENLAEALAGHGVDPLEIRDPFNIFQNSPTSADGVLALLEPVTKPGDRIVFRALMNLVGAVSACPQDFIPVNGFRITDLKVLVSEDRPC